MIEKYKSNRDYERELRRHARDEAALVAAFGENMSIFESVWYGRREATPGLLQYFSGNVNRISVRA